MPARSVSVAMLLLMIAAFCGAPLPQARADQPAATTTEQPTASTTAPGEPGAARGAAAIAGRITDPDGRPIAGALIEWGLCNDPPEKLQRTSSDERGDYRIELQGHGMNYRLSASAPGRAPQWVVPFASWNHSLRNRPPASRTVPPQRVDFQLEPEHRLPGVVVDPQGLPISGVRVTAQTAVEGFDSSFSMPSPPMRIPGGAVTSTVTNDKGRFHLAGLPARHVHLSFKSPHRHVNDGNYPVDREHRVTMTGSGRAGVLRVRVVDADTDRPVTSLNVVCRHDPEPRTFNTPDGRFEWDRTVTEGERYELHFYSREHAPAAWKCTAFESGSTEEELVELLPGRPLLGRLVDDRTGKPLAGIPIMYGIVEASVSYFEWPDLDAYVDGLHGIISVQRAVTDAEGRFWFSEAPDVSEGSLFILTPGYERLILRPNQRPAIQEETGESAIRLHPEATISGVLLKADATQPDPGVSVWKASPRTRPEETFECRLVGTDGKFVFPSLGPGTYWVYSWRRPVRAGAPTRFATVTLGRGEHKVLEAQTMEPADQDPRHP